jgi:hypothetical protein
MKTLQVKWKWLVALYMLIVLASTLSARANTLTWMPREEIAATLPKGAKFLSGQVGVIDDQTFVLVTNQGQYELFAQDPIDLKPWIGKYVKLMGVEPRHTVGPVYQNFASSPLLDQNSVKTGPSVLVVLRIIALD